MKVKLIKQYIIDSIFKKKSSKINQNKLKRQLNLFKVVGYNEYIRNFIDYRKLVKDFTVNIFLENLEKYFLENVMDEDGKIEYENLNKKTNEESELININLINNENEINDINKEKTEGENKFFDLRGVLSEDAFNEIKQDVLFENK